LGGDFIQEELENKSVSLSVKASKVTAKLLAEAMKTVYREMKKPREKAGKMSFKQLSKGGALSEVDVTNDNIKSFDPVARKYGIRYSLQKDASSEPPLWRVYFRAKDADSMTAAFKEFSDSILSGKNKDKPSVKETMHNLREKVANAVRDITRKLTRKGPEL
jgi:hypothetical protein